MSYQQVSDALKNGADPAMLCMTCPWDRFCLTPPSMSAQEIDQHIADAKRMDAEAAAKDPQKPLPIGTLVTTMVFAGRDTQAKLCPVLAMRLKLPEGRTVVDLVKQRMQSIGTAE